jgi:hypothetical protein
MHEAAAPTTTLMSAMPLFVAANRFPNSFRDCDLHYLSFEQVIGVLIDFDIGSDRLFAVGGGRMLCFCTSRVAQNPHRLVRLFESDGPGVCS